jgi:hypothetical protein
MRLSHKSLIATLALATLFFAGAARPSKAWVNCAGEGGECVMNSTGHNLVRYGAEQKYFILEVEGTSRIGCGNGEFGDPAHGAGKGCEYMPAPAEQTNWAGCATEGQNCRLPDNMPRRVRYGVGQTWVYKIYSSSVPCNNDWFPDIASGRQKYCQYSNQPITLAAGSSFQDCGTESAECKLGQGADTTLVRYGAGNVWQYRLATTESVRCGNGTFGDPLHGQTKFCQFANLPTTITDLKGTWNKVGGCFNCPLSLSVQVGISGSRSQTNTKTWSEEVSTKYEQAFPAINGKGEIGYKRQWGGSEAITDALTRQKLETKTASCTAANRVDMYQYTLEVDESCYVQSGRCKSIVSSFNILCAQNQSPSYKPVCAPSACTDALCTTCQ